jgi:hypothetical protein
VDLAGATLVVTLEPCCHHGKTPPCTDSVLRAGFARVVVGAVDPFPAMRGRSIALLAAAGVAVETADDSDCIRQILGFRRVLAHGLPAVTAKAGLSLDGRLATASGESQWITGELARADAHLLRAAHDALGCRGSVAPSIHTSTSAKPATAQSTPNEAVRATEPSPGSRGGASTGNATRSGVGGWSVGAPQPQVNSKAKTTHRVLLQALMIGTPRARRRNIHGDPQSFTIIGNPAPACRSRRRASSTRPASSR